MKKMALVFTGDEFYEGMEKIIVTLRESNVKGSFFFTGRLYRNPAVRNSILRIRSDGHYLGPHSDMHLLYNDWERRDQLLVSRDSMKKDLLSNYSIMKSIGIEEKKKYFIPPFEWWNKEVSDWCNEMDIQLISFTPGIGSNADYTYPEMGVSYKSSSSLMNKLFAFEQEQGLEGAIVLIHIGTDPRREDKLYDKLPEIINRLRSLGYEFMRVDDLLNK